MPVTVLEGESKSSRFDLRVEPSRKAAYERAAATRGQSLSQWSLANLDAAAERDITAARTLYLSDDEFAEMCRILDEPTPKAMQDLLAQEPIWV